MQELRDRTGTFTTACSVASAIPADAAAAGFNHLDPIFKLNFLFLFRFNLVYSVRVCQTNLSFRQLSSDLNYHICF